MKTSSRARPLSRAAHTLTPCPAGLAPPLAVITLPRIQLPRPGFVPASHSSPARRVPRAAWLARTAQAGRAQPAELVRRYVEEGLVEESHAGHARSLGNKLRAEALSSKLLTQLRHRPCRWRQDED